MNQATLRRPWRFEGVGLHTGQNARVEVRPAAPNSGLTFVLGSVRVPATAEYVTDTSRATALGRDGATVSTTEHLLSALFAMGVSNADVHVEGPEIPVRDGSSAEFAQAIAEIGLDEQPARRTTLSVAAPFVAQSGDRLVAVLPSHEFRVRFVADFAAPIGTQYYALVVQPQGYREEIAAARTFGYLHEVEALRARGLALGGSLDNALVFAPEGPLQPLRWPNEVVRHKILDLIGDLALLGAWPLCEIVAIKSGHELHAIVTRALRKRTEPVAASPQAR
ncbi:MAG TPA: UDP-3-O-acyl-N-acetylglucosamine deacetylase [Verrucomicrobiae bacterium]|nr:UDP-3-O-acyl-N-acetylglucosamine deacetylase [Verrucomicrobiae bacterium]